MTLHKRRESGNLGTGTKVLHPKPKKLEVVFDTHGQRRHVKGKNARTLLALVKAAKRGVTALEVSSWAYRLAAYCFQLRHRHHLAIEMVPEGQNDGWHGRYVLHTPVHIVRVVR